VIEAVSAIVEELVIAEVLVAGAALGIEVVLVIAAEVVEELVIGPASVRAVAVEASERAVTGSVIGVSAAALVEAVLEADPVGLAEQAHVPVAVEALPAWEVSVVAVAAAAVLVAAVAAAVAAVVAVVVAVAAAAAEGGKSHERDEEHAHNRSFFKKPILVLLNRHFAGD
jgi:hypothetical protein